MKHAENGKIIYMSNRGHRLIGTFIMNVYEFPITTSILGTRCFAARCSAVY